MRIGRFGLIGRIGGLGNVIQSGAAEIGQNDLVAELFPVQGEIGRIFFGVGNDEKDLMRHGGVFASQKGWLLVNITKNGFSGLPPVVVRADSCIIRNGKRKHRLDDSMHTISEANYKFDKGLYLGGYDGGEVGAE